MAGSFIILLIVVVFVIWFAVKLMKNRRPLSKEEKRERERRELHLAKLQALRKGKVIFIDKLK